VIGYFFSIATIQEGSGAFISLSIAISSMTPCTEAQKHPKYRSDNVIIVVKGLKIKRKYGV
jgi:hypothetical protein